MSSVTDRLEEDEESIHSCAHCRRDAHLICNGCNGAPDDAGGHVLKVWYCGPMCQKIDWAYHKTDCRAAQARKILHRAASTAQRAFYILREKLCDKVISKIEKVGSELHLSAHGPPMVFPSIHPFASDLISDERDRQIVLADGASEDVVYLHGMLSTMLQATSTSTTELKVKLKTPRRMVQHCDTTATTKSSKEQATGNPNPSHTIFQTTLKIRGETYAIDLSGAQYGQHDLIIPWESYRQDRIRAKITTNQHRYNDNQNPDLNTSADDRHNFANSVDTAVLEWEERNMDLHTMLKLPEDAFRSKQTELLQYLDSFLHALMERLLMERESASIQAEKTSSQPE